MVNMDANTVHWTRATTLAPSTIPNKGLHPQPTPCKRAQKRIADYID